MKRRHQRLICLVLIYDLLFLSACASHRPQVPEPIEQPQTEKSDQLEEKEILQNSTPKYVTDKTVTSVRDERNRFMRPPFHDLSCVHISKTPEEDRVYFYSLNEALGSGPSARWACKDCSAGEDLRSLRDSQAAMRRNLELKRMQERKRREKRGRDLLLGIGCGTSVLVVAGLTALDRELAWPAARSAGLVILGVGLIYFLYKSGLGELISSGQS